MKKIISDMSKARGKSDDYEGDRVFAAQGPEPKEDGTNGTVITRLPDAPDICSIGVSFDNDEYKTYFSNGYYSFYDSFPTLFWSQPDIVIPERPRRLFLRKVTVKPVRFSDGIDLISISRVEDLGYESGGPEQEITIKVWEGEGDEDL